MRLWLALTIFLLSLTTAHAQNPERTISRIQPGPFLHELPELTPEETAKCTKAARQAATIKKRRDNFRECDNGGCYFFNDDPDFVLTEEAAMECRFQKALQRRLEEHHKRLEAERESGRSN